MKAILYHLNFPTRHFLLPVVNIYESLSFQCVHLSWKEKTKESLFISGEKLYVISALSMSRLWL